MRELRGDGGQAAPLVGVLLVGLVALLALVSDAGMVLSTRRDLQQLADAAARAGAGALDEDALRGSGGTVVVLDPDPARRAALSYLAETGFGGQAEVSAEPAGITVVLATDLSPMLGRVLGAETVRVHSEGRAAARSRSLSGIEVLGGFLGMSSSRRYNRARGRER